MLVRKTTYCNNLFKNDQMFVTVSIFLLKTCLEIIMTNYTGVKWLCTSVLTDRFFLRNEKYHIMFSNYLILFFYFFLDPCIDLFVYNFNTN